MVHEMAPDTIISLSWAFLLIPCLFLLGVFAWIFVTFSQPSELDPEEAYDAADEEQDRFQRDDNDDADHHEKDQLLDAFRDSESYSAHSAQRNSRDRLRTSQRPMAGSSWKINSKFSSTSRGGSVFTSYPDPGIVEVRPSNAPLSASTKSKCSSLTADNRIKPVGVRAARAEAAQREKQLQDLEQLDPIDRVELQRSPSATSSTRKSD
jgi:hypothetical protein